ncbi:GNAT family N-acetyltransferase [Microbacterium sp. A93]|uniref:GNAT family N-acetyltransferase n=1 Tax=Microbacterium sp. A93 TaxID=3450716 RepID=UPI003F424CF2
MTQPTDPEAVGGRLPGLEMHRFAATGLTAEQDPVMARMLTALERNFYEEVPSGPALDQVLQLHGRDERTYLGVYDAGVDPAETDPVGTYASFVKPLQTGVGRQLDAFLISEVTVRTTHRRRGILRAMMTTELDRAVAGGWPVAALSASEATIYRRFGFGVATVRRAVQVDTRGEASLMAASTGTLRMVEPKELAGLGPALYARALAQTPGSVGRVAAYTVTETDSWRSKNDGRGTGLLAAVHEDDGGTARGYVTYRFSGWKQEVPTITVTGLVATTAASFRALWDHLVHLDLIQRVEWGFAPQDGLLENLLTDPRRVKTSDIADQLWLRILDVPAAFAGRPYHRDGELVLGVTDPLGHAAGTWRLSVRDGTADVVPLPEGGAAAAETAEPDTTPPDLTLDVAELSSVYLGGVSAELLRQAGRLTEHRPGAAAELTALLAADRPVFCMTGF